MTHTVSSLPAEATLPALPPQPPISADRVLVLQSMRAYPSVTLLANSEAGPRMDRETLSKLRFQAEQAVGRLRAEGLATTLIEDSLRDLLERAAELPAERSVAVFASENHADLLTLPVSLQERVVVDPTFATRDLVRALHRTPRHLVLLVSTKEARLLEVQGTTATPVLGSKFPFVADEPIPRPRDDLRFLRRVDEALGAYLRLHPAPVVVAGAEPTASAFTRASRHLSRLAGTVTGNHLRRAPQEIAQLTRPLLEDYLAGREAEALSLLEQRIGQDRAVMGVQGVWRAAHWERVEMLAVDPTYFVPARICEDPERLELAEDVEAPDVIDDVVDEVIELVLDRGGWVALVEPGRLPEGARIALTLRDM